MILGDVLKTITLNPGLSIKELNKSISLNPNNAEAYVFLAYALIELGRFTEGENMLLKAEQLDPVSMLSRGAWTNYYLYSRNTKKFGEYLHAPTSAGTGLINRALKAYYFFLSEQYDSLLVYANRQLQPAVTAIALAKTGRVNQATMIVDSLRNASEN